MENPLKNLGSRRKSYDKNEEKLANYGEKLEKTLHPNGHLAPGSSFIDHAVHEFSDNMKAFICPKNWVKIPFYDARIKSAKNKLEIIYQKDKEEAQGLNDKYNELIKQAAETGNDSELKEFERDKLGMHEVSEKE